MFPLLLTGLSRDDNGGGGCYHPYEGLTLTLNPKPSTLTP